MDEPWLKEIRTIGLPGSINFERRWSEQDRQFMRLALDLARRAEAQGEVPVGAVIMQGETVIGQGWNRPIASNDPTSHAEIEALRSAGARIENYRLPAATLYVTVEPCAMCAGAIVVARVERLVFAARDLRFGAVRSKFALADSELMNHRVQVEEGLFAVEAADLLAKFFAEKRAFPSAERRPDKDSPAPEILSRLIQRKD